MLNQPDSYCCDNEDHALGERSAYRQRVEEPRLNKRLDYIARHRTKTAVKTAVRSLLAPPETRRVHPQRRSWRIQKLRLVGREVCGFTT